MGVIAKQGIRGTILTYAGTVVGAVTTLFVVAHFLTAEDYGLAQLLIDMAVMLSTLMQLGTGSALIRFWPWFSAESTETAEAREEGAAGDTKGTEGAGDTGKAERAGDTEGAGDNGKRGAGAHGFLFWAMAVPLAGFVLIGAVYALLRPWLADYFGQRSALFVHYYWYVLPLAAGMLYQTVAETCSTVQMRIVFPKGVREVGVRLGMMGVYLAYGLGGLDTDGMVGAICGVYGAAAIVNICYLIFSSNRNGRNASGGATETKRNASGGATETKRSAASMFRPDFGFLRANRRLTVEAVHYMAFVTLSALVSVLAPYLSSFIISARQGLDWNGIFKMAFFMSAMVSIPSRSLTGIASPELSAAMSRGDQRHTARLTQQVARNLWIAGWLITAAIWLNIDLIFHILPNGSVYEAGRETVLLLSLSQLLLSTFSITLVTLTYSRHYRLTLVFSLLLTLLTLVLGNQLIPRYGITGAATANLLAYCVYYSCLLVAVRLSTGTVPFSRSMLLILAEKAAVFGMNAILSRLLATMNVWLSALLRDALLLLPACLTALRLSPEMTELWKKTRDRRKSG